MTRLTEHQEAILRMVDRASEMVAEGPSQAAALSRHRWELTRVLRAYQLFKHNELLNPAIASGRLHNVALAQELKRRCLAASDAFQSYVLAWSARDTVGEWEVYRHAMHAMSDAIRRHIAYERRHMTAALLRIPDTRRTA